MSPNDIESKVKAIICDQLVVSPELIRPDMTFEELRADSLAIVEFVIACELEFKLSIPDEAIEHIKTVKDAVDYVTAHAP